MLTVRFITPTLRNGELLTAIAASVLFTAGFYIPLKQFMGAFTHGHEQLRAVSDAADRAAGHLVRLSVGGVPVGHGLGARHQPAVQIHADRGADAAGVAHVGQRVPLRGGLAFAILCGHVIGFRFHGGPMTTAGSVCWRC